MTQPHPDHGTLAAFVRCALEDGAAASVAIHLDQCPACAAWVGAQDPLSPAFASVDDPLIPCDLVSRVLAAAPYRPRAPRLPIGPEPLIAALLLGLAAILLLLAGGPASALTGAALVLGALVTTAEALLGQTGLVLLAVWVVVAAVAIVALGLTMRQLDLRRLT